LDIARNLVRGTILICLFMNSCNRDVSSSANVNDVAGDYVEIGSSETAGMLKLTEAAYEKCYPSESSSDNIYLFQPVRLAIDYGSHIYVLDSGSNCLYKFSSTGNYLQQIGARGAGPGEFLHPSDFSIVRNRLYVSEIGNFRIQKLSINGIPERSIRKYLTQYSMTYDEEGLIYIAPLVYGEESRQIAVVNNNGEIVRSFGKPMVFAKDTVTLNFVYLEKNARNEIFAVYRYFPIIRKYSQEGELLFEHSLNNAAMRKIAQINMDRNRSSKAELKRRYILNVIATRMFKDHLFLFCQSMNPFILEYDDQGKQTAIYRINRDGQYIAKDLIVMEDEDGRKIFHLLQVFPESKVDIYSERAYLNKGGE